MKGSCPGVLLAASTRLALAPFTCCAGVLTGGADAEAGADPAAGVDDDPPFPGVVPDEPGFVVVSGVVVIVSIVVVVSGVDSVVVV